MVVIRAEATGVRRMARRRPWETGEIGVQRPTTRPRLSRPPHRIPHMSQLHFHGLLAAGLVKGRVDAYGPTAPWSKAAGRLPGLEGGRVPSQGPRAVRPRKTYTGPQRA